jgi:hypothetical protein
MIENKEHKWSLEATENKVLINSAKKDLEPNSKVAIRVHGAFLFRTKCMVLTLFFLSSHEISLLNDRSTIVHRDLHNPRREGVTPQSAHTPGRPPKLILHSNVQLHSPPDVETKC